jgi:hypothetical protein
MQVMALASVRGLMCGYRIRWILLQAGTTPKTAARPTCPASSRPLRQLGVRAQPADRFKGLKLRYNSEP